LAVKIPVFLSAPSVLNDAQQEIYDYIVGALNEEGLQPRALGRSDFPQSDPMTEVYYLIRATYGGLILGFSQVEATQGTIRRGTPAEAPIHGPLGFATPWNQIEAGMLHALRKPIIVFCEANVSGGVFDRGAVSGFLKPFTCGAVTAHDWEQIRESIRIWSADVRKSFRS
jgi:hypothetical protein